jgi:RimJ/RimL family protein N-acetyltransferase
MELLLDRCVVRSWLPADARRLSALANDRRIWRNLRDRFPHPYALNDAESFIAQSLAQQPERNFCISVNQIPAGSIGITLGDDIYRKSAELGYWLGVDFWGQGIVSDAVQGFTQWAFEAYDLLRIHAAVFEWNPASARVLEKAGYVPEGRRLKAAVKDGESVDEMVYAIVRP